MSKLDTAKQKVLDDWALAAAKGVDVKAEVDPATSEVTKPGQAEAMMQTLQGELTEIILDAAMTKALTGVWKV